MTNKERLEANNAKIDEIKKTLAKKQVSPNDMLQQMVDQTNSCENMFYYSKCNNVDFLRNLDTSNVTNMNAMFNNCQNITTIDLSAFNTKNLNSIDSMFYYCKTVTTINLTGWDYSSLKTMYATFSGCSKLTKIIAPNIDTSKVTNMWSMFSGCPVLETIPNLDLLSVTDVSNMFRNCYKLANLTLKNIKKSLTIGSATTYGHLLTNDSLINTIQQLWDLTGMSSQTLTLSTTSKENIANIYVKLVDVTDEMLAQDQYAGNKKPCVVCESTDEGAMTLTEYATSKNWAIA